MEAEALDYASKLIERGRVGEVTSEDWRIWSAVLAERTAFKHDVFDAPSAEPERKTEKWIPCSERLPERHQTVLITIYGTDVIRMKSGESFEDALARVRIKVRVSVGYCREERWYGADGYPMIVEPIAWMPMPEPYREDDHD